MIRLILFGGPDIVGPDGRRIVSALEKPKPLALLAYLVLAGPSAFRSRDTALALFWPESDRERARHSLNQALHLLRGTLGAAVIVSRGQGEVGVAGDALWCDAVEFEAAISRGDAAAALHLYRGPLLPGYFIAAAPEFDQWLDEQRDHFRRQACRAAWILAEAAEQGGQFSDAAEWARRATELSPDDEAALQKRLRLLDRIGDRARALQAYEAFAERMAKEFEATPSAESQELMRRIRSRAEPRGSAGSGDETAAQESDGATDTGQHAKGGEVAANEDIPAAQENATRAKPGVAERSSARAGWRRTGWLAAAAVLLVAFGAWGIIRLLPRGDPQPESPWRARVAVGPFADADVASGPQGLGRAITDAVVARLADIHSFEVVRANPSSHAMVDGPTRLPGRQLSVTGRVLRSEGQVRVFVQVTGAASGRTLRAMEVQHDAGDPFSLVDAFSRQIASAVRVVAGREARLAALSAGTRDRRAGELVREADADRERAGRLERSATSPAAVRALEDADSLLEEAEAAAPTWREPMIARSRILQHLAILSLAPPFGDSTREAILLRRGMDEARRAVTIDRRDAEALEALGSVSYWYWLVVRLPQDSAATAFARAVSSPRRAVAIDPARASAWSLLSAALYSKADFAGAYLAADKAYEADAYLDDAQEILDRLFVTSYEIGDDSAAGHWCDEMGVRFPDSWSGAYCQLRLMVWRGGPYNAQSVQTAWQLALEDDQPLMQASRMRPRLKMLVAAVLARSGLPDSAEDVLQQARSLGRGDPELLPLEASARIALHQPDSASQLLLRYVRPKPLHRQGIIRSRRFASLHDLDRLIAQLNAVHGLP